MVSSSTPLEQHPTHPSIGPPSWKTAASALPKILHLLPYHPIKINRKGIPDKLGRFLLVTAVPHSPSLVPELRNHIRGKLFSQPLPLSPAQALTFQHLSTDAISFFKFVHLLRVQPAIQSFAWRLLSKLFTATCTPSVLGADSTLSQHSTSSPLIQQLQGYAKLFVLSPHSSLPHTPNSH